MNTFRIKKRTFEHFVAMSILTISGKGSEDYTIFTDCGITALKDKFDSERQNKMARCIWKWQTENPQYRTTV